MHSQNHSKDLQFLWDNFCFRASKILFSSKHYKNYHSWIFEYETHWLWCKLFYSTLRFKNRISDNKMDILRRVFTVESHIMKFLKEKSRFFLILRFSFPKSQNIFLRSSLSSFLEKNKPRSKMSYFLSISIFFHLLTQCKRWNKNRRKSYNNFHSIPVPFSIILELNHNQLFLYYPHDNALHFFMFLKNEKYFFFTTQ